MKICFLEKHKSGERLLTKPRELLGDINHNTCYDNNNNNKLGTGKKEQGGGGVGRSNSKCGG